VGFLFAYLGGTRAEAFRVAYPTRLPPTLAYRFGWAAGAVFIPPMKPFHAIGWPAVVCTYLVLALPATAQTTASDSKPKFEELARKAVVHSDHTVTFVRVKPMTLPKAPLLPAPPELTAEQKATAERRANKSYESITVTANVYVGTRTVTELSWQEDGVTCRALSSVDFRLLTQLTDVETKDTVYLWLPFVSASDGETPTDLAAGDVKHLSPDHADYVLLGPNTGTKATPKGLDLLDYLHAYAQLNDAKLRSDLAKREADELAAEEKRKNTPPPSPVITFWLETGAKR